jgi:hypothetical protein
VLKIIYFRGIHLIFILLQLNIYLVKKGEPERMLGNCFELSEKLYVISRTFQRVKVPLGRVF